MSAQLINSWRTAAADGKRSPGSFAIIRRTSPTKPSGTPGVELGDRRRLLVAVALDLLLGRSAGEWGAAGQGEVDRTAQRVDVAAGVHLRRVGRLLRRDVVHRADDVTLAADHLALAVDFPCHQGQAQVEHLGVVVGGDDDVRRLEVAVDQPLVVGVVQRQAHLGEQPRQRGTGSDPSSMTRR